MPILPPDQTHYGENGDASNLYTLTTAPMVQPAYFPTVNGASVIIGATGLVTVYSDAFVYAPNQYWRLNAQFSITSAAGTPATNDQVSLTGYIGPVGAAPYTGNATRAGMTISPIFPVPSVGGYSRYSGMLSGVIPTGSTGGTLAIGAVQGSGNGGNYQVTVVSVCLQRVA